MSVKRVVIRARAELSLLQLIRDCVPEKIKLIKRMRKVKKILKTPFLSRGGRKRTFRS